ncbi:MAG: phage tail tape measure protein, partial [Candidatus Kariarchaeaceae archaeon]
SKATNVQLKLGNTNQLNNISKRLTTISNSFNKLNSNLKSTRTSIAALNSSFNKAAASVNTVAKSQSNLTAQAGRANASLKQQSGLLGSLAGRFGSVAKQAIAFGLISRPIYDLQRALTQSVKAAVAFEKEIVKISQVTGQSVSQLSDLTKQITQLSTSLGVGANELAETARIIAQTGRTAQETETILKALARSTLAPTFGKITDTTEGLVAALAQFNLKASDSEAVLGSLNKISKNFAVESEDLISAIRRTGGVFAQAAGQSKGTVAALQELSAIFTAVRSTTRESADTIAAGLRTIFSRIQRRGTIDFLRQFNVELTDAKGNFVGVFPAFDQLSKRLDTLIKQGDALTLSAIAEELGGIRQIGKLLPAIAQFDKARKALEDAQKGAVEGLGVDVAKGLDTIDNRLKRVRETFNQLIRTVFESDAFQNFTKNILTAAENFLKFGNSITQALEPILPLLTTLGAFKIGAGLSRLIGGGGGAVSTVTGQASATANKQTASAAQKTAAATTTQNNLIINTNKILTNILNQVSSLSSNNSSGFNKVVSAINSKPIGGALPGRRRAGGGSIPKFANGGRVYGPSHAAGGVIAELEGGEYVVPKQKFQEGGSVRKELAKLSKTKNFVPVPGGVIAPDLDKSTLKVLEAKALTKADPDTYAGTFLRPEGARATFEGTNDVAELEKELLKNPVYKNLVGSTKVGSINLKGKRGPAKDILSQVRNIGNKYLARNTFKIATGALTKQAAEQQEDIILRGITGTVNAASKKLGSDLGFGPDPTATAKALKAANIDQVIGNIFETILSVAGVPFGGGDTDAPNAPLDFPKGLTSRVASQFAVPAKVPTESKTTFSEGALATFNKKVRNFNLEEAKNELLQVFAQFKGSGVAGDTLRTVTGTRTNADAVAALNSRGIGVKSNKVGQRTDFFLSPRKAAAGGVISRFQTGGEVPVRISNGEMVVSDPREVAARKGELQSINKLSTGGFASGSIARGPGTGTSDSIYTTLPAGAFVVNAASTKKFLGLSRGGGVQRFQRGGQPALNALVGAKDTAITNLVPRLRAFVGTQEQAAVAMKALTRATAQGATAGEALARAEFAVTQATAQETRAKERAAILQKNNNVATRSVTDSLNLLKNSARKASGGTLFGSPKDKAAAGGGGGALGAVFALSALTSTLGATDSALGKFAQELTTVLFTLTAFSGILPTGSVSGIKGALSTGLSGRAGIAGIGIGAGGTALGGLGAGLAGGFVGKSIGNAIADATVGREQKIGRITGSQSQGAAQQRAGLGFGGAVLGGAAAGAALGTFIAPGIGTAIGAAVGAGGGAIVGALTTPFDVIAKQAAFEVAQDLQDGGKAVKTSLDTLAKDFNQITFGRFGDRLNKEVTNFTDAFPELTEQLFQGGDALKSRTGAFKDAISTFSEAFKPEDIARASEQSSKAFDQFVNSLSDEELQRLSQAESTEQLNQALIRTAKAGGDFGKQVLRSRTDIAKAEALSKAAQLSESGSVNTSKILTRLASTFDFVNGNAEELENALSEAARAEGIKGDALRAARKEVNRFAKDQREAATEQSKESVRRAQLNRVLTESAQKVNAFTLALDNSIKG